MSTAALAIAALLAASLPGSYACEIAQTTVVTENGVLSGAPNQFPEAHRPGWRFGVEVRERANATPEVEVRWPPASLIELGGTYAAVVLEPNHLVVTAMARSCLFGSTNCPVLIQLAAREDGSLGFTILPTGLTRRARGSSELTQMNIIFTGSCRRQNGS
ncbi:MAG TPA: hypothetical protein VGO55_00250 [Allosphingosinicella sp.]|nr:hypothetical protein [Allosphingosinicella sp.]